MESFFTKQKLIALIIFFAVISFSISKGLSDGLSAGLLEFGFDSMVIAVVWLLFGSDDESERGPQYLNPKRSPVIYGRTVEKKIG